MGLSSLKHAGCSIFGMSTKKSCDMNLGIIFTQIKYWSTVSKFSLMMCQPALLNTISKGLRLGFMVSG